MMWALYRAKSQHRFSSQSKAAVRLPPRHFASITIIQILKIASTIEI